MRTTLPYTLFKRELKSGKTVYYYQFRDEDGKRSVAKSTGCTTLAAAKRFCQSLYNGDGFDESKGITFSEFTSNFFAEDGEYCTWRAVNNRPLKTGTIVRYKGLLEFQLLPYFKSTSLEEITKDSCKKWIIWASGQWSPKTVNHAQGALNIILESAVDKKIIDSNPLYRLGLRAVPKKDRNLLTIEEIIKIYHEEWITEPQRAAFLLATITGMRIGEVMALQKDDIKGNKKTGFYLDVTKDYSDAFGLQSSTKTYLNRYVPIPSNFPFPESKYKWLFPTTTPDLPARPHSVYQTFVKKCKALGIDVKERKITLHTMRGFYITYLRSKNVPDAKIRAVTGHADSTMTGVYTYWKPDMFPEVYEAQKELFEQIIK